MSDDELFFVRDRNLDYPVFDSDNHMYENPDAFTKFIPSEYEGIIKYVEYDRRTKLTVKDRISRAIPNPTFARVAPPGGQHDDPVDGTAWIRDVPRRGHDRRLGSRSGHGRHR